MSNLVPLFQHDRLLRTKFLAAETTDACIGINTGKIVVTHGQSRYRTLIDTGSAGRAQLGIGLRAHAYAIADQRLYGLILKKHFAAKRGKFKIGQRFQFTDDFNRTQVVVPQSNFLRPLKDT